MKVTTAICLMFVASVAPVWGNYAGDAYKWSWPTTAGPVMTVHNSPVAQLTVVQVKDDGSSIPAELRTRKRRRATVTETWALSKPAVDVVLSYSCLSSVPATRISLRVVNRTASRASVCLAVEASLRYHVSRTILFDFTKSPYVQFSYDSKAGITAPSWTATSDQNYRAGLYGFPNRATIYNSWGPPEFCNPLDSAKKMYATLYLPIVSLYNESSGGLVAWCDPRSHIGFDGDGRRLRLQHTFYLPAGKGSQDAGFEPGDGTGPWPYNIYFAYSRKPTWDLLYSRFFMATAPDLRSGNKAMAQPGMVTLQRLTDAYLPLFRRLGIKYTGGVSTTYAYVDGPTLEEMRWARDEGVESFAKDETIAMLIELKNSPVPYWEPRWVWERYKSSVVKDKNLQDVTSGQGKYGNTSPRFPFGRDRLQAMIELFDQGYGAFYTDLYLSTVAEDWGHPIGALPFYPMQRAFYEYLGAIAKETRKRGMLSVINAPHPSCLVGKDADWMTFDTDAPIWLWCRSYGDMTGIHVQVWTNLQDTVPKLRRSISDALAFGIITGPYTTFGYLLPGQTPIPEADKEKLISLYERHYRLAYDIGGAKLVKGGTTGGRPGPLLYYKAADGKAYITVQNLGDRTREMVVPLELTALGLAHHGKLLGAVWDIDGGLGQERELDPHTLTQKLTVKPGMTSVLVLRRG